MKQSSDFVKSPAPSVNGATPREHILYTLNSMIAPGQVVELRILGAHGNKKRTDSGYFDDMESLSRAAANYDGKGAVYITPNPVDPDLLARANNRVQEWAGDTTNDLQITKRRWLLIDADPERISGISSTDAEHKAAIARIGTIVTYLSGRGWPNPVQADSGNGAHANYRIDLPNTPENTLLIQRCLLALSMQFTDESVKIDTGVFNASRIWKLYGTRAIKGDNTPTRPHRYARIISHPEQIETVSIDLLQSLASLIPDEAPAPKAPGTGDFNLESWMTSHGITGNKKPWNSGNRWRLDKCFFSDAHTDGAFIVQFANGAIAAGCAHNTCQGKNWHDLRTMFDGPKEERKRNPTSKQRTHKAPVAFIEDAPAIESFDDVLAAIQSIGSNGDLTPKDRKTQIVRTLSRGIGDIDRSFHTEIVTALERGNAGFTQTDAKDFVRGCMADAKKRNKETQRQRAEQARVNLLNVRESKGKASIDVGGRQLSDIVDQALTEVCRANGAHPTVFVRGGALARVTQDEHSFYGIQEMSTGALLGKLSEVADWETVVVDMNGIPQTKAVFPPKEVVTTLLNKSEWPGIPALSGIVTAPVFSRDGVLHDQTGYNPATRLYYAGGVAVGDTTPTHANIEQAKALILDDLLVDFPFADASSRAHAVAYLLLPFVRDMIDGPTPVHDVDAPTAGTGKGKLLNACAYPFLGGELKTMPATTQEEEWRKRITSALMDGSTHLVIDNVNHELDSGALASAFTQPVWGDRELGINRLIKIPIRTIWAITANNIKLSPELTRRCVWIRLDANAETPETRMDFKHKDLMGWVKQNRGALVTAALTLVRAWIDQGMHPYTESTKGSYEAWTEVMGGILSAAGIPGFLDNEAKLRERVAPKRDMLKGFIAGWWDKFGTNDTPAGDLFKLASFADDSTGNENGDWCNLLGDMLGSGNQRSRQTRLGFLLGQNQDQVVCGFKILHAKTERGMKFWRLEQVQVERSTNDSQVVEATQVERGRTFPLTNACGKIFFTDNNMQYRSETKKNKNIYAELGENVLPRSTQTVDPSPSTGGRGQVERWVERSTQPPATKQPQTVRLRLGHPSDPKFGTKEVVAMADVSGVVHPDLTAGAQ